MTEITLTQVTTASKLLHRYGVSRTAVSLLFRNLVAPSISSDAGGADDGIEPPTSETIPGALPSSPSLGRLS